MFKAFRIRPVVESMDENGEVTCEAFATLAAVERDSAQFEARRSVSGREGKTIIWTLYGVNPEESGVRTEYAIADRDTEESARELLTSLIGPFTTDEAGYSTPATLPAGAAALLTSALGHIQTYKDTEEVDCIALAEDSIAAALNTLMQSRPAQADSAVAGTPGAETAPADPKSTQGPHEMGFQHGRRREAGERLRVCLGRRVECLSVRLRRSQRLA